MPTAKARYLGDGAGRIGDGSGKIPSAYSSRLRKTIRSYYPQQNAPTCPHFGHPADTFVEHVLCAANNAVADMMWQTSNVTKQELRAEQKDMRKSLTDTRDKLRKLSPSFSSLLEHGVDPLGVADSLDKIISQINAATHRIDALPKKKRPDEAQHDIAFEMAYCVLHVLKANGIEIPATCGSYLKTNDIADSKYDGTDISKYISDAIKILKAIGDDIGLVLSESTWRDIIIEVKKTDSDLQ
jgi:hypothetical protein